jgi:hypothetical protein
MMMAFAFLPKIHANVERLTIIPDAAMKWILEGLGQDVSRVSIMFVQNGRVLH